MDVCECVCVCVCVRVCVCVSVGAASRDVGVRGSDAGQLSSYARGNLSVPNLGR